MHDNMCTRWKMMEHTLGVWSDDDFIGSYTVG